MRIIMMGTPDFAVPTLHALVAAGHEIAAVYTQPPRPAGRGKKLMPSPMQARADALGLAVRHPESLKSAAEKAAFAALNADVAVVAAYGLLLPQAILDAPKHGCLNVHGSILPRWRGAAPVQRAILAGDAETGVTIMEMEKGLDTGSMRLIGRTAVARKTAGELTDELAAMGARLMVEVLADLPSFPPVPQPEDGVTYAAKIDKVEARIDWTQSAAQIERQVRAFNPFPGAFFEYQGERFKLLAADIHPGHPSESGDSSQGLAIPPTPQMDSRLRGKDEVGIVLDDQLSIACGDGVLRPALIQRAGKAPMRPDELLRGFAIPVGTRFD